MKKIFNGESLISLSAFFISLCAIIISIIEVRVMNEQKEASVWPHIFTARSTATDNFKIVVKNSGVGPAKIKSVEVSLDGKVKKYWSEIYEELNPEAKVGFEQSTLTNRVIIPGERFFPFVIKGEDTRSFSKNIKRIRLKLCYCSIYEQCWVLDESKQRTAGLATPYPVEECKIESEQQFLQ